MLKIMPDYLFFRSTSQNPKDKDQGDFWKGNFWGAGEWHFYVWDLRLRRQASESALTMQDKR